jgi:hypothetical protein
MEVEMEQSPVRFAHDIRPLFRDKDVARMAFKFDLSSYDDVRANSDKILRRLTNGSMPCDGAWPADRVTLFHDWVDAGCPP